MGKAWASTVLSKSLLLSVSLKQSSQLWEENKDIFRNVWPQSIYLLSTFYGKLLGVMLHQKEGFNPENGRHRMEKMERPNHEER